MTYYTERTPRVVAARKLTRRATRDAERRFLAEGPQAVREALVEHRDALPLGFVSEVFLTDEAGSRFPELRELAGPAGVPVSPITPRAAEALSETVTPQGVFAVCHFIDVDPAIAFHRPPALAAVLADIRDPGNAGTVLRSADAAGARTVVFAGESVDPYNGKAVRASAGSLFHVTVVRRAPLGGTLHTARKAGLTVLAAAGDGECDLDDLIDDGTLARPTAWVFGNEAAGLRDTDADLADLRVRVPIHGRAESLNLAAAAAVCLYASAREQRSPGRKMARTR